jgi:hypothetical protein
LPARAAAGWLLKYAMLEREHVRRRQLELLTAREAMQLHRE